MHEFFQVAKIYYTAIFATGLSERPLTFDVTFSKFSGEFSMTPQCFAVSKLKIISKLKHVQTV